MREACIILPCADQDGAPIAPEAHENLKARLIAEFGGVTITPGLGYWRSAMGHTFAEGVMIYTFASASAVNAVVHTFATLARMEAKQEAIYMRDFDGNVFVE